MAAAARLICSSADLVDSGRGVRFDLEYFGERVAAFVVRFGGRVRGYLNRCGHTPMELDWRPGEFFSSDGSNLICSTHGAIYHAAHGGCVGGPCSGVPLVRLRVEERGGCVYYMGLDNG